METLTFPTEGGELHALRWGTGPQVAVALHGITANAMSWKAIGEALPDDWQLVAVDLRGRGHSRELPGPYDFAQLTSDVAAVLHATGARVLVGHSLGAYLAAATNLKHPDLIDRVILIDGGLPLPVPADPDQVLAATIGPALDRLRQTWPTEDAYVELMRSHPALGPYWNAAIEAYARYDSVRTEDVGGGVRARAIEDAVRASGRELLTNSDNVSAALAALSSPTDLVVAERGMFDQPGALIPDPVIEAAISSHRALRLTRIPDTNHYTIVFATHAVAIVVGVITGMPPAPVR